VARNHQSAACVRRARANLGRFVAQPAGEKSGRKCIARPKHIQHFDFNAAKDRYGVGRCRHLAVDDGAAHRPALDDKGRIGHGANGGERLDQPIFAARNAEFFLGAEDKIDQRQDAL
jgi:hypothetical protein